MSHTEIAPAPAPSPTAESPARGSETRAVARRLDAIASLTEFGLPIGIVLAVAVFFLLHPAPGVALAVATVFGALLGALIRGLAAGLGGLADHAEAIARIERLMASGFERLASAPPSPTTAADPRVGSLAETRRAIRTGDWANADALVRAFADAHPDAPESALLADELSEARQTAAQAVQARIGAAREANDPDRVLDLRDGLKLLLAPDVLHALDRDLAKWCMALIHRRLRSGTVRADVAVLAGRVAECLDDTAEGASLRASLPTLRRAGGLCARCAKPYTGVADACPACLGVVNPPTAATPPDPANPEEPELQNR